MILCLDFGERYVGIAITDPDGKIALRHSTIDQKKEDALERVLEIVEEEGIDTILVGVPVSLEGEETQQTHESLKFLEELQEAVGLQVNVESVDETLTSVEAMQNLEAEGTKPNDEHAEAARLMLAEYLASQD